MKGKAIIYQILPRLFGPRPKLKIIGGSYEENGSGKLVDLSEDVLKQLVDLGMSHLWLTGLIRHASMTAYPEANLPASHHAICKGQAGSPYAIKDYYDIHPDLALDPNNRMTEFENLVERIHDAGLKLIIDFVPNHVSRDYSSIAIDSIQDDLGHGDDPSIPFSIHNNFYYLPDEELRLSAPNHPDYIEKPARVTGNDVYHAQPGDNDWYETIKINYGYDFRDGVSHFDPTPGTWIKMCKILDYWAAKGVDGFRCDMAGMVPQAFWQFAIREVKKHFTDLIFIAEIYEAHLYKPFVDAGFDYLYDKVGLYDQLRAIIENRAETSELPAIWQALEGIEPHMLRFLENHDEQRIASSSFAGDPWPGLAGMAVSLLMNTGPGLVYFGQELGESATGETGYSGDDGRTSIFDYTGVPSIQAWLSGESKQLGLRQAYYDLIHYARQPFFSQAQFYDLTWANSDLSTEQQIFAFLRHYGEDIRLIVACFNPDVLEVSVKIPRHAIEYLGLAGYDRVKLVQEYPDKRQHNLLISQLSAKGVYCRFSQTGWAAHHIRII